MSVRGDSSGWRGLASDLAVSFALVFSACSISAGAALTRPSGPDHALAVGPSVEGSLQLPRTYQTVAGIEWTRSRTASDAWRLGMSYGLTTLPTSAGRVAWEATLRGGLLGPAPEAGVGGFGGLRIAMLLRLGRLLEPWHSDAIAQPGWFLVADAGANGLAGGGRSLQSEVSTRLMLRFNLSSALFP
jgi:hypothetical protein